MRRALLLLLLLWNSRTLATTWGTVSKVDPISGSSCSVDEPMSWGSYVYQWPSKYDGVYWPHTEVRWIWFCPESGYASFGEDFEKLVPAEVERIRGYLAARYVRSKEPPSALQRLVAVEAVYKLRDKDESFWGWFKRVKAVQLEALAMEERRAAIPLLEREIERLEAGPDLIQRLYVLGDYYRLQGEVKRAREAFARAKAVRWKDPNGQEMVGLPYFDDIIAEREKLIPAGESE